MHHRRIKKLIDLDEKNEPHARFLNETKCAAGKAYQSKCATARFFDWILIDSLFY